MGASATRLLCREGSRESTQTSLCWMKTRLLEFYQEDSGHAKAWWARCSWAG